MVKDFINRNFVLKIQVFTFFLAIITPLFNTNLLILVVLYPLPQGQWLAFPNKYWWWHPLSDKIYYQTFCMYFSLNNIVVYFEKWREFLFNNGYTTLTTIDSIHLMVDLKDIGACGVWVRIYFIYQPYIRVVNELTQPKGKICINVLD
jgi:hypothetical protein